MTMRVDFTSQAFFQDPAAGIEKLRACGPVVETRFPIVGKVWITTTYESTARVLKDSETFKLRKEGGGLAGLRWWMPAFVGALANNMLTMDEPDHTRLRGIVDEAFRRRAILGMEPRIRAIADALAGQLFADGSPADLVERYARTLPLSVICELLGLPPSDRLGKQGRAAHQHHQLAAHDPGSFADETLPGGAPAARPRAWWGGPHRRARACRNGGRAHQRQRNGVYGLFAIGRRIGNDTHLISGS